MNGVAEIESVLRHLPRQEKWQIALWLLEDLEQNGQHANELPATPAPSLSLPDYGARRRRIFGDKILPNMVLAAREEESW